MTSEQAEQVFGIAVVILTATWRLSSQITKIDTKLNGLQKTDSDQAEGIKTLQIGHQAHGERLASLESRATVHSKT